MKCEEFQNYLFENPDAKALPEVFFDHLSKCEKCSSIWEIQESLATIEGDEIEFSLSTKMEADLILQSRKEFFKSRKPFSVEESLIISFTLSLLFSGIIVSVPNILKSHFSAKLSPYLKIVAEFLEPYMTGFQVIFSNQQGNILGFISLFLITFAFTFFVKTLNPKKATTYF